MTKDRKRESGKAGKWASALLLAFTLSSFLAFSQSGLRSPAFVANLHPAAGGASWTETDESGLVFFYDYSGTNAGNGNPVAVWPDLSGNAKHATNTASTITYQTGGPNAKPYLQWAGNATDVLINSSTFTMEPGTFFVVYQQTFTNENKAWVTDFAGGFGTWEFDVNLDMPSFYARSASWDLGVGSVPGSSGPYGTNWSILTHTYAAGGDFVVYTNHVASTNGNNDRTLVAPTGWALGGIDSKGIYRIARLLAYDHVLTAPVRSNLINKAKTDFGL